MKKTISAFTLLAGAVAGYAQGTIQLSDYIYVPKPFCIDVFSPQTNNPTVQMTGNTILDWPMGTVGIGGGPNEYQGVAIGGGSGGEQSARPTTPMAPSGQSLYMPLRALII